MDHAPVRVDRQYFIVKRADHIPFYNLMLPADDPFWDTHYPPNGWGCKCSACSAFLPSYRDAQASVRRLPPPRPTVATAVLVARTRPRAAGIDSLTIENEVTIENSKPRKAKPTGG